MIFWVVMRIFQNFINAVAEVVRGLQDQNRASFEAMRAEYDVMWLQAIACFAENAPPPIAIVMSADETTIVASSSGLYADAYSTPNHLAEQLLMHFDGVKFEGLLPMGYSAFRKAGTGHSISVAPDCIF